MTDHQRFLTLAALAVDGLLEPDEARELERHLAGCDPCRAVAAAMRRDHQLLGSLPAMPVAPRIRVALARAASDRPRRSRGWTLVAVTALLIVALGGGMLLAGGLAERVDRSPPPTTPTPTVTSPPTPSASTPSPGGALGFGAPTEIHIGGTLRAIATADLDGDGDLDLLVTDLEGPGPIQVLLGDGAGRFGGRSRYNSEHPFYLDVADLDLDGALDVATGNPGCTCIGVLYGDGRAGFGAFMRLTAGLQPRQIVILDADADGWPDLAVPNASSDQISILLGGADRKFAPAVNIDADGGPLTLAVADFDADGRADLVSGSVEGVTVYWGVGGGNFRRDRLLRDFERPAHIAVGDIDRDGDDDIAVRSADRETVIIGYFDQHGPFFQTTEQAAPRVGHELMGAVELSDLSGDGWLDLVVGSGLGPELLVYVNDGTGRFAEPLPLRAGRAPVDVAIGDFDGDGRSDIATVNYLDGSVSVFLQR